MYRKAEVESAAPAFHHIWFNDQGPVQSLVSLTSLLRGQLNNEFVKRSGPDCSKIKTLLVNISLKFQMLISEICQYYLLNKCKKLLHCQSFSHFFKKKKKILCITL